MKNGFVSDPGYSMHIHMHMVHKLIEKTALVSES